jgi:hypothetical protein
MMFMANIFLCVFVFLLLHIVGVQMGGHSRDGTPTTL